MSFSQHQKLLAAFFAIMFFVGCVFILFSSQVRAGDESLHVQQETELDGSYTMAEVESHGTGESCWATINGGVYDLTTWVNSHPGGPLAILALCGENGTTVFNAVHGGSAPQEDKLAEYKIGTFVE
ncbi:MAG: cytochrome b5 domain-containing protein [Candidatus Uhrbacteria bacterium]|nr:cytochrome b5 domain-containing protein [Candidatus Uhrbacteria bacterium]